MTPQDLIAKTDLCVKCGLCLPHCPTYGKTSDENESPRGRLSLIQGWARGTLKATPRLTGHVDNCLLCRACEAACPAQVPYGDIIDTFRAAVPSHQPLAERLKSGALRRVLTSPALAPMTRTLSDGSSALVKTLSKLAHAEALTAGLPSDSKKPPISPGVYPARTAEESAHAALFTGCTGELLDRETLTAALGVMTRLGVRVTLPDSQTCCGALHQHGGDSDKAGRLRIQNLSAFGSEGGDTVVSFASGCGAMLREYDRSASDASASSFSARVRDISQYLESLPWPDDLLLRPLNATVCLHAPCSLKNVLRADRYAAALLKRIPNLNVVTLPTQTRCCGAAGSYMLEHPDMANSLRDDVLDQIVAAHPSLLVTSNPGCALHLRAGLRQRGLKDIEVVHPVTLLARQLAD